VFDEVITGFGRTGSAFGSQSFAVTPDIMTMAKALTNGAQPMGAVAVSDIRGYGMMAGIDLAPIDGKPGARGMQAQKDLFHAGLHIKFTGDSGIPAPALVTEKEHIDQMCQILRDVLSSY